MENVNWSYLSKAIEFYKGLGYKYVEVPWFVPMETIMITCPSLEMAYEIKRGDALVGSAEQSLMQMSIDGRLEPGRYVACSPCFRDEPVLDSLHQKQFMKVELFDSLNVDHREHQAWHGVFPGTLDVIAHAMNCMESLGMPRGLHHGLHVQETEQGCDIDVFGIEMGSYGQRTYMVDGKRYDHIYGTGLAEPRFSGMLQTLIKDKLS